MLDKNVQRMWAELETGIALPKCQKCGCMESTLKNLAAALTTINSHEAAALKEIVSASMEKMRPVQYSCLGCEHCYPAVAQNAFGQAFPMHLSVGQMLGQGIQACIGYFGHAYVRFDGSKGVAGYSGIRLGKSIK